jgi:hypothetical protein
MKRHDTVCRVLWLVGAVGLIFSHWILFSRREPLYTFVYAMLWWSLIFVLDGIVYRLRRRSILHDRPFEFFLLALWSVPFWFFFELWNLKLNNWFYVQAPRGYGTAMLFMIVSFATVLPGLFEMTELVRAIVDRVTKGRGIRGPRFPMGDAMAWGMMSLGGAMALFAFLYPRYCFALVWGCVFFLLDATTYMNRGRSLTGQASKGDYTTIVSLVLAGFLCGGTWEAWNIFARTKWIYTVPFLENFKLGEMPLLGYIGYPPFAFECYAFAAYLALFRNGRHWENTSDENRQSKGMDGRMAFFGWVGAIVFVVIVSISVFSYSILSSSLSFGNFFNPILKLQDRKAISRLRSHYNSDEFIAYDKPIEGLRPEVYETIRQQCEMAEIQGIGLEFARALSSIGIYTPEDLAGSDDETLAEQLQSFSVRPGQPRPAQVRVWIRAAKQAIAEKR